VGSGWELLAEMALSQGTLAQHVVPVKLWEGQMQLLSFGNPGRKPWSSRMGVVEGTNNPSTEKLNCCRIKMDTYWMVTCIDKAGSGLRSTVLDKFTM
jgi:hypothetical protein